MPHDVGLAVAVEVSARWDVLAGVEAVPTLALMGPSAYCGALGAAPLDLIDPLGSHVADARERSP